jgi:hypothetical protein
VSDIEILRSAQDDKVEFYKGPLLQIKNQLVITPKNQTRKKELSLF